MLWLCCQRTHMNSTQTHKRRRTRHHREATERMEKAQKMARRARLHDGLTRSQTTLPEQESDRRQQRGEPISKHGDSGERNSRRNCVHGARAGKGRAAHKQTHTEEHMPTITTSGGNTATAAQQAGTAMTVGGKAASNVNNRRGTQHDTATNNSPDTHSDPGGWRWCAMRVGAAGTRRGYNRARHTHRDRCHTHITAQGA